MSLLPLKRSVFNKSCHRSRGKGKGEVSFRVVLSRPRNCLVRRGDEERKFKIQKEGKKEGKLFSSNVDITKRGVLGVLF